MWMGARSGGALAPPVAVAIMALAGWRYTFMIFGAVGLVWCAVFARWYRDDPGDHPSVNSAELRSIRAGAAPRPQIRRARSVEGAAAKSHDDRSVLQLFRIGLRISVLCHMAADVFHARAWFDAAAIRRLRGAAAGGGRNRMLDGRPACRLDYPPHRQRYHRQTNRRCEWISAGRDRIRGSHFRRPRRKRRSLFSRWPAERTT